MKHISILFYPIVISLWTANARADQPHPPPANVCYADRCTPQQETIWQNFETAGQIASSSIGKVFSGDCYYIDPNLNPYARWTAADAIAQLAPTHSENSRIRFESNYAWLDFNPGQVPIWQYYVRQMESNLLLIGFWGHTKTLLCELPPNQPGI